MAINNGKTKESLPIDLLKENLRYDDIINKKKKKHDRRSASSVSRQWNYKQDQKI